MRKNKLSTAGLAAILSVALMSGGIFAWFASKDTAAQVDVSTGDVKIDLDNFVPAKDEILPGTSVALQLADGSVAKMHNKGSKAAVIELDLSQDSLIAVLPEDFNPDTAKDWNDTVATQYELKDVKIGDTTVQRYVFGPERLNEIAKLDMDADTQQGWAKVEDTNKFYTVLEKDGELALTGLKLTVDQELGGNVGPKGGTQTASRQFEQETQFIINIKAMGTQATSAAVKELYGDAALAALEANGFVINE